MARKMEPCQKKKKKRHSYHDSVVGMQCLSIWILKTTCVRRHGHLTLLKSGRGDGNFERRVGAPVFAWSGIQGGAWPGSLPFPVCAADARCRIMGGITSCPAVLIHRSSQTNTETTTRSQARPSSCSWTGPGAS